MEMYVLRLITFHLLSHTVCWFSELYLRSLASVVYYADDILKEQNKLVLIRRFRQRHVVYSCN